MDVLRACLGFPKQDVFESVNVTDLPLNHAYILANTGMDEVGVYTLADDCIGVSTKCCFFLLASIEKVSVYFQTEKAI